MQDVTLLKKFAMREERTTPWPAHEVMPQLCKQKGTKNRPAHWDTQHLEFFIWTVLSLCFWMLWIWPKVLIFLKALDDFG